MSTKAEQLEMLEGMYAKGVTSLEQGGEKVAFASGEELRRRIRDLKDEISAETGGASGNSGFHYPTFNKGF